MTVSERLGLVSYQVSGGLSIPQKGLFTIPVRNAQGSGSVSGGLLSLDQLDDPAGSKTRCAQIKEALRIIKR